MTNFLGPEAIVDAAIAKLQTEMPARVAAINLEKTDGIEVAAPDTGRYYDSARRLIGPGGPAILVMDGPMSLIPGGEGPHSLLTETLIAVWVMDEDSDERRLGKKLQRLARAAIESLWDGAPKEQLHDADGRQVAYRVLPHSVQPGKPFEPDHDGGPGLREFYVIVFSATRLEGD